MTIRLAGVLSVVFAALPLSVLRGQETTGDLRGRLRSHGDAPITGARITASGRDLLGDRTAVSKSDGVFALLSLPPGRYTVRVTALGYVTLVVDSVTVQLGRTSGLGDLTLQRATTRLAEVRISAPAVTLDPNRTTMGGTLESAEIAALPGERDYLSIVAILPQVNTSYHGDAVNSAGSTGLENMYFIDGVNVTAPLRADRGTRLPYNFVRSVEVRAGGYEAQYGRALGAIVNAVTYSGTNTFESTAFGFFTHSSLAGTPKAGPALRETRSFSYDAGGRVSGPVVRDRLWFSAAYNPRRQSADREIAGLGHFVDRQAAQVFASKLTWRPDAASQAELSIFGDPMVRHAVEPIAWLPGLTPVHPDPYLTRLESGGVSTSVRGSRTFGTALLVEGSLGTSWSRDNTQADRATTDPLLVDQTALTLGGGTWGHQLVNERRTSAMLRATATTERHILSAGVEVDASRVTSDFATKFIQRFGADSFLVLQQGIAGSFRNKAPAGYVQDSWRVAKRLTLGLGLRWESQRLIAPTGETAQRFANEWQPRLGFSLTLDSAHTHRVIGSFGRFYQLQPLWLSSLYYADYLGLRSSYHVDPRIPGSVADTVIDFSNPGSLYTKSIEGASAERFDEFSLGYERLVASSALFTARATHRHLGTTFQQGIDLVRQTFYLGTPGHGDLSFLPTARRDYTSLELSLTGSWRSVRYRTSYVLSRNWGNYPGLYQSDVYSADPGANYSLNLASEAKNSTGYLPNDRTHVFKVSGTNPIGSSLVAGAFLVWESGTPLSEFGVDPEFPDTSRPTFLVPRGSNGRTPTVFDLNVRFAYSPRGFTRDRTKLLLDVLHVGNFRTPVRIDQQHLLPRDESGRDVVNPDYRKALAFVPPMMARVGLDIRF